MTPALTLKAPLSSRIWDPVVNCYTLNSNLRQHFDHIVIPMKWGKIYNNDNNSVIFTVNFILTWLITETSRNNTAKTERNFN